MVNLIFKKPIQILNLTLKDIFLNIINILH